MFYFTRNSTPTIEYYSLTFSATPDVENDDVQLGFVGENSVVFLIHQMAIDDEFAEYYYYVLEYAFAKQKPRLYTRTSHILHNPHENVTSVLLQGFTPHTSYVARVTAYCTIDGKIKSGSPTADMLFTTGQIVCVLFYSLEDKGWKRKCLIMIFLGITHQ